MSANASSLRRILRSIGTHATPTANALRASPTQLPTLTTHARHSSTAPSPVRTPQGGTVASTDASTGNVPNASLQQADSPGIAIRKVNSTVPHHNDEEYKQGGASSDVSQPHRYTSNLEPTVKDGASFGKQYFRSAKASNNIRMKQRARRRALSKQRSEISENEAWQDILRLLEQDSPSEPEKYIKRMETITLPEGIFAKWIRDPNESILEVMQHTGSHVQVIPGTEVGLFSSLTLLGRPAQNALAKKLLQESDYLAAVSQDDLNTSKSLADYHLRLEVKDELDEIELKQLEAIVSATVGNGPTRAVESESSTRSREIEGVVSATVGNGPTRAVWSESSTTRLGESIRLNESRGQTGFGTAKPRTAVEFTDHIRYLTTTAPRTLRGRHREATDGTHAPIHEELTTLLTSAEYARLVTPLATGMALRYLARHMYFPAVRSILNALKDVKFQLDADLFNALLNSAAQRENVVAFFYIVNAMRQRTVTPNAGTWVAFHTLMLKRFPSDAEKVITRMRAKFVDADRSARIDSLEAYSEVLLATFIEAHPNASIKDFVENINRDMPGVKWLTTYSANKMCRFLLSRGHTTKALELVDELVRHGGRPDVVTLNTFLASAKRDGSMSMAISILRKFRDLHRESIALASTAENPLTVLPRAHDLSIAPNRHTFKLLFDLAWDRKYFNCTRVFWRYACCAGHPDSANTKLMRMSASSKGACGGLASIKTSAPAARAPMWWAWAAKFVMGVKAGLGPAEAAEVLRVVRPIDILAELPPTGPTGAISRAARAAAAEKRRDLVLADRDEVQSLLPVRPLAETAEEAFKLDREWKQGLLGLQKGYEKYGGEAMLGLMLEEGIQVPVEVGDGVGMKL